MDSEIFARIGLAFSHLLNQSSVNGPARDEVVRLAAELQSFEGSINSIVDARVTARVDAVEGRLMAYVDQNLTKLAEALEAAEIPFTPEPAPPPVEPEPAQEAAAEEPAPAPTTGNIPAPVDPNEPAPAPADPVQPAEGSTSGNIPHVPEDGGDTIVAAPGLDTVAGGEGMDSVTADTGQPAVTAAEGGEDSLTQTDDPDQMTVQQATDWLDAHEVDHAGVTKRDDLRELVRTSQGVAKLDAGTATGAADTTVGVAKDGETA